MKARALSARSVAYSSAALFVATLLLFVACEKGRTTSTRAHASTTAGTNLARGAKRDAQIAESFGKLPLAFEANLGQTDSQVRYLSHGEGYQLFLTPQEAVLALRHAKPVTESPRNARAYIKAVRESMKSDKPSVLRLQFAGANAAPEMKGFNQLPGKTNYFSGDNRSAWHTDVPNYSRVSYRGIYPGIDLVFYGNQRRLEYDFAVAPGADPKAIAFNVQGARKLRVDNAGNLVLSVPEGEVQLEKPIVYQEVNGEKKGIAGNYELSADHRVSFAVSAYDHSKTLVIDPVLNYSTYLGGSSLGDVAHSIAVDAAGDAYVTGVTFSVNFPTTSNAFSTTSSDTNVTTNGTVFVTELNPAGTAQLYSTYLSGNGTAAQSFDLDAGFAIAVDPAPSANCLNASSAPGVCIYVAGTTYSTNFPTTASANEAAPGSNPNGMAFLTKLNPALTGTGSLVYSTYIGGTGGSDPEDIGIAVAVDATSNAYVAGFTNSTTGFPIQNAFQATVNGSGFGNAFLTRIDTTKANAASLIYSTYLGGGGQNEANALFFGEQANGVAVDTLGDAYVAGVTSSTDFPVSASALQTFAQLGGNTTAAGFVSVISTSLSGSSSLLYSTYLGGSSTDDATAIALGPASVAFVTGSTKSTNFPLSTGAYSSTQPTSSSVAFLSLIDASKTGANSLKYSTYLGGNNGDQGNGVAVDALGKAYIVGTTNSTTFPVTPGAFQIAQAPGASSGGLGNAFVSEIDPSVAGTTGLVYSTYFGGSGITGDPDQGYGIGIHVNPLSSTLYDAYITGTTFSDPSVTTPLPIYPNTGSPQAFQTMLTHGNGAAYVAKLTLEPTVTVSPLSLSFTSQVVGVPSAKQTVTVTNNMNAAVTFTTVAVAAGSPAASGTDFATTANTCTGSVAAGANCTVGVIFTPSVAGAENATLTFTDSDASSPQTVALSGSSVAATRTVSITPTSLTLTFGSQNLNTTSAAQTVTVMNTGNAPVTLSAAPVIGGTNAGDFAIQSGSGTTCSASTPVAASASCTIAVTFTPTAAGSRGPATLTIADNATGSPQTVTMTGTGAAAAAADFSFTIPSQAVTVVHGSTTTFAVSVVGTGGFTGAVSFTCSASIPNGNCTPPLAAVNASPTPGTTATFTIATHAFVAPPPSKRIPPISKQQILLLMMALALLLAVPMAQQSRTRLGLAGAMMLFVLLAGCSGSGNSTPAGNYTLTVTGTSGSLTHSSTVTLTVQ